jgi:hypothetical protein
MTNARPGTLIHRCAAPACNSSASVHRQVMRRPQFAAVLISTTSSVVRSAPLAPSCCSCYATMRVIGGSGCWQPTCTHMRSSALLGTRNSLQSTGCPSEERICGLPVSTVNTCCSPPVAASYRPSACIASLHCGTCVSRSSPCTAPNHVRCAAILCTIQPPIDVCSWRPVRCVSGGSMTPWPQRSVSPVS